MKVYWLDFSLNFRSCCLLRVCRKFGPKLASHYKPVENEVKFHSSSKCPKCVRRTNIRPVKNGLYSHPCLKNKKQQQRHVSIHESCSEIVCLQNPYIVMNTKASRSVCLFVCLPACLSPSLPLSFCPHPFHIHTRITVTRSA